MNCLEFRRLCLTEPRTDASAFVAHRRDCEECRRFSAGIDGVDAKVLDALQVPVPENLNTRIKLRQILGDEHQRRGARPWQWALAASVLLTVTLGGVFAYQLRAANAYITQMQAAAVEHVGSYHDHVMLASGSPEQQFQQVLGTFGGRVAGQIGPIARAFVCAMNNQPIAHAELTGGHGIVTVLYVAGPRVAQETEFARDRYTGVLMPAGRGNLVVLGAAGEDLGDLVRTLKTAISWRI